MIAIIKKTIILLSLLMLFVAKTYAFVHVVEKGETLESIASIYDLPKAVLIKANPGCDKRLYIGQKLQIPMVEDQPQTQPKTEQPPVTHPTPKPKAQDVYIPATQSRGIPQSTEEMLFNQESTSYHRESTPEFETEISAGLSLNNFVGKDADDYKYKLGFNAGFTARYYFSGDYFLEGALNVATKGYKLNEYESSGPYWDDEGYNYEQEITTKYNSYNLDLPILIGYRIKLDDDLNFKVKVGPYLTYVLSGKKNIKGYHSHSPDIHSSEKEYIDEEVKIGDMSDFKKFGYGVTAAVSADFEQLVLTLSYQRAFSKVFGDAKKYEQNFLISLGYRF